MFSLQFLREFWMYNFYTSGLCLLCENILGRMTMTNGISGPQFVQYFQPVIDALNQLGGSGRPSEVKEIIAEALIISDEEQNEQISSGASKFGKNVDWARYYLAEAGFIDRSVRGVWSLTESGRHVSLNQDQALSLFQEIHKKYAENRKKSTKIRTKNEGENKK